MIRRLLSSHRAGIPTMLLALLFSGVCILWVDSYFNHRSLQVSLWGNFLVWSSRNGAFQLRVYNIGPGFGGFGYKRSDPGMGYLESPEGELYIESQRDLLARPFRVTVLTKKTSWSPVPAGGPLIAYLRLTMDVGHFLVLIAAGGLLWLACVLKRKRPATRQSNRGFVVGIRSRTVPSPVCFAGHAD